MKCPKCRRYIEDGSESHGVCGWNVHASPDLGYQQCDWVAETRCMYPGSISPNIHAGGPYYCSLHFGCKDPMFGASVVEASKDYRHPTEAELAQEHLERAKASLKAKGLDRKPDESAADYRRRCLDYLKQNTVLKDMRDAA